MIAERSTLVVDDHPVFRRGLAALLDGESWTGEVVLAASVAEARVAVLARAPEVAVVDLRLPDGSGFDILDLLAAHAPECRSLVLTMESDASQTRQALDRGALGFVVKDADDELVLAALRTVASGGVALGAGLGEALRAGQAATPQPAGPFLHLTPREVHIATMVGAGAANSDIARTLGLTDKTVRNQVSAIIGKVGANGRVGLALLVSEFLPPLRSRTP